MDKKFHTLAVWCTLYDSWGSLITSARQDVIEGLAKRIVAILPVQVRIIQTATGEDDDIVPVLLKLRRPRVRNVDDPANDGTLGYSVFDEVE